MAFLTDCKFMYKATLLILLLGPCLTISVPSSALQEAKPAGDSDPFNVKFASFELRNETIFDGVTRLSQLTDVAFSIEGTTDIAGEARQRRHSARAGGKTLPELLDWLCELDGGYTWSRDANIANLFPRAVLNDRAYIMNLSLPVLTFEEAPDASSAVLELARQLPEPRQQLAVLKTGGSLAFSKPWTQTFTNITVRQALNSIARQLGQTHGWQLGGKPNFRMVMFHARLGPPNKTR